MAEVVMAKKMTKGEIQRLNRATQQLCKLVVQMDQAALRGRNRLERQIVKEIRTARLDRGRLLLLRAMVLRLTIKEC